MHRFLALLLCIISLPVDVRGGEETPPPFWLAHVGTVRPSDPAVARKGGVVRWRPWNAETFEQAAKAQKPVYVFVTSNAGRGGAEMERTVLGDFEVTNRLNADFVPIRLNRDAFPETELRLQQALLALKNARGWPLNVFLTPDGEIISVSTSLPLHDDPEFNRPGMITTLTNLTQRWAEDRTRIAREAGTLCRALKRDTEHPSMRGTIPANVLNSTALKFQALLDRDNGGFRSPLASQFPEPRALELCLAHYARTNDRKSLEVVEITLDHMLRGGFIDQLEGGFHHFCIDRQWRIPRFEKLPLLNAEMICLLLHTWQATGNGRYRSAAEDALNFWRGELDDGRAFFPASIAPDAYSFEDGAFYTWSLREIEALFTDESDVRFARKIYGIDEVGNQPYTAPDRTVLSATRPLHEMALEFKIGMDPARKQFERIRKTMRAARALRAAPARDDLALCDANSMLAAAFLEGGRLMGRDDFVKQGFKTLAAILKERRDGIEVPRPVRHVLNDPTSVPLALDEAARAWACLQAFETSGDSRYQQLAIDGLDRLDANYHDLLRGGYIERSFKGPMDFATAINWRTKSIQDTSEPSTNGLIATVYVRLFALTSDPQILERAKAAVESVGAVLATPSPYNSTLATAADAVQQGIVRIKIIGREGDAATTSLLSLAHSRYYPWKTVMRFDSAEAAGDVKVANIDGTKPYAIVETKSDKLIAESLDELNTFLDDLGKPPAAGAVVPIK